MPAFIEVAYLDGLAPGKGASVAIGSNTAAVFKVDDAIRAIEASCLRCGADLAEGTLQGKIVACRGCDWRYDVTVGCVVGIPALRLVIFDVKVVGGQVIIANP